MGMSSRRLAIAGGIGWGLAFVAARLLLEQPDLGVGTRALLAFGPTVPLIALLMGVVGLARESDEMERRIQVEALAFAFGGTILLVGTLALAQRAGFAKYEDFSFAHLLPILFVLYLGGTIVARRRYACEPE